MTTDKISLDLQPREVMGKAVKRLRKDGIVPAVIHDHGKASVHVQGDYQAIFHAYQKAGRHHPVQVKADGKNYTALIKSATFDPKYNAIMHVVFASVKANEKVTAEVPVHPVYAEGNDSSPAERSGLIVLEQLTSVEIEALPRDLPNELTFDAEKLINVGDHITVADLRVPEGVVVKTDPAHSLATVFEPSALQAANEAAAGEAGAEAATDEAGEEQGEAASDEAAGDAQDSGGQKQSESKE